MNIVHDIPIKVLKSSDITYYTQPQVPPPTVALELPRNNKLMRTIVDKMSKISRNVHLSASQSKFCATSAKLDITDGLSVLCVF